MLSLPMTWRDPKHPISSILSSWVFFHIFRTAKAIVFKFCTQAGVVMVMWAILSPNTTVLCTSLETDNHASTSSLSFYRPHALPVVQPMCQSTEGMSWNNLNQKWKWVYIHLYPSYKKLTYRFRHHTEKNIVKTLIIYHTAELQSCCAHNFCAVSIAVEEDA